MRQNVLKWRPVPTNGHISLMTSGDMNTVTSGNNSINMGVFSNTGNVGNGMISSGQPSLPARKPPQRTFVKDKTNSTAPIAVPNSELHQLGDINLTDTSVAKAEQPCCMNSSPRDENYGNGYLTPTDPPTYMESYDNRNTVFSFSPTGSETSPNSIRKGDRRFQRFDSGVGDCESVRGSSSVRFSTSPVGSTHSVSNPRLSTQYEQQYEDIDQYTKSHEHYKQPSNRPVQRSSIDKFSEDGMQNDLRQLPSVDISGVTNSDTEDSDPVLNLSLAEAMSDPMHDPRVGSLPHTYMPLNTSRKHHSEAVKPVRAQRGNCCLITAVVITLLISLAALSLSIYIMVSKQDLPGTTTVGQAQVTHTSIGITIDGLQQKIDDLKKQNAALKEVLLSQQNNLTSYIEQEVLQLVSQQQTLSSRLQLMAAKFDAEVANISLKPGPQGPPGVANFSQCVSDSRSQSAPASARDNTESPYLPSDNELQNYFVTFAYCTYSGATSAHLETLPSNINNRNKYRCKCWGQVTGVSHTVCTVTIWMCPQRNE